MKSFARDRRHQSILQKGLKIIRSVLDLFLIRSRIHNDRIAFHEIWSELYFAGFAVHLNVKEENSFESSIVWTSNQCLSNGKICGKVASDL